MSVNKETQEAALELISSFIPGARGRKPANLPALTDSGGRALPRYLVEKVIGTRRENGALKLKRLTNRHLKLIGAHLEGLSLEQIAHANHLTIATVSRVLNDPLAQAMLKRVYTSREGEIQALGGKAVDVVRRGLDKEQPIGVQLRAVDRYTKLRETMLPKDKLSDTAEDVIARMLERGNIIGENIQINIGGKSDAASNGSR